MDCAKNAFCSTLPQKTRTALCLHCRRLLFRAGSVQMRDDAVRSCTLILDGLLSAAYHFDRNDIDHQTDMPALYLGLPGRLIVPDYTLDARQSSEKFAYNNWQYLTDTWVATFSWKTLWEFIDADPAFTKQVLQSALEIQSDMCQFAALFRANYTYYGIYHFLRILSEHSIYLPQQQIANLMNRDRTAISKAYRRIKEEYPELWIAYSANKERKVSDLDPHAGSMSA